MSKHKDETHDRIIVPEDFRALDNVVRYVPRTAPLADICEEPTRTIVVNELWAKHIFGAIGTLALWKAWTGDDDERNIAVQQVMKLLSGECDMPTGCDDVADCIENSPETITALNQWFQITPDQASGTPDTPLPEDALDAELLPPGYTCDDDHKYGMAVGIVEYINSATTEVFQAIEILTNPIELSAELVDNVPLVSLTASALDVIAWIQNTAFEAYNLYWSDATADNLSCELFCLMQEEETCTVTFNMIWEVYTNIPDVTLPSPLDSWVVWFEFWSTLALSFGATDNVKVMSLLALTTIRYGGKFGSMVLGIRSLSTTVQLLADDENPDWASLCTDCNNVWKTTLQFNEESGTDENTIYGAGNWVPYQGGVHVPGQGWTGSDFEQAEEDWRRGFNLRYVVTMPGGTRITFLEIIYSSMGGNFPNVAAYQNPWSNQIVYHTAPGTDIWAVSEVLDLAAPVWMHLQAHADLKLDQISLTGYVFVSKVIVTGTGPRPPEFTP